uniref:Cytosol aminopeptidase domain-containing protein n=1 Tax=Arcella intermedia TaxID=1963864 RepID=A0A6B2L2Q6_9EUKA
MQQIWPKAISADFSGKEGQSVLYYSSNDFDEDSKEPTTPQRILWMGLGKEAKLSLNSFRTAIPKVVDKVQELKQKEIVISLDAQQFSTLNSSLSAETLLQTMANTFIQSNYQFNKHLTKEDSKKPSIEELRFTLKQTSGPLDLQKINEAVQVATTFGEATNLARNLANERGDVCNPKWMEEKAKELVSNHRDKLQMQVIDSNQMNLLGMNLFYSVGKASTTPPRLVLLKYMGDPQNPTSEVALVGKGITFDTGGLNLKSTGFIEDMYLDMSGSAAVLATMATLPKLNLKMNVVGALCMAENAIGSNALLPNSILKSYKGLTVEIGNTDAEGRLVLADGLSYVQKHYSPKYVIDIATLTGACCVALGEYASGLFTNDQGLEKKLMEAADSTFERTWPLPLFPEYSAELKGQHSDLKSIGKGRYGGACTAAAFLKEFIEEGVKWAHLDIAGPAMTSEKRGHIPRGGTGYGVQLLLSFLQSLQEPSQQPKT